MTNHTSFFNRRSRRLVVGGVGVIALIISSVPFVSAAAVLNRQLETGMSGADVSALQTFLAADRTLYPEGLVTGYFGPLTSTAVANFQTRNNLEAVGRVGPRTLALINERIDAGGGGGSGADMSAPMIWGVATSSTITSGTGTTSTTTTGGVATTISWNTNEPARGVVYYGTSPLTEYELPHTVTIGGTAAMTDTALRSSHAVTLSTLQRNMTYYYDIYVTDAAGNSSMTMQSTFRTPN